MYYTNILNRELQEFHKKMRITGDFEEISKNFSQALQFEKNKIIPLFYTGNIIANENVTILDDLVILYMNNEDLKSVYFKNEEELINFNVLHKKVTINNTHFLKLHFYDSQSLLNLSSFEFELIQGENSIGNFKADNYGNINIEITNTTDSFTIKNGDVTYVIT